MRRWEYHVVLLQSMSAFVAWPKGWKLRQINEREIPDWKKTETIGSVAAFCNYMDEQGWDLISTGYRDTTNSVSLIFKRPYTDKMQ